MTTYASIADVIAGFQALPVEQLVNEYVLLAKDLKAVPDPTYVSLTQNYQALVNALAGLSTTLTAQITAQDAQLTLAQQQASAAKSALVKATAPLAAGTQAPPGTVKTGAVAGIAVVAGAVGAIGGYWWADHKKAVAKKNPAAEEPVAQVPVKRRRRAS